MAEFTITHLNDLLFKSLTKLNKKVELKIWEALSGDPDFQKFLQDNFEIIFYPQDQHYEFRNTNYDIPILRWTEEVNITNEIGMGDDERKIIIEEPIGGWAIPEMCCQYRLYNFIHGQGTKCLDENNKTGRCSKENCPIKLKEFEKD